MTSGRKLVGIKFGHFFRNFWEEIILEQNKLKFKVNIFVRLSVHFFKTSEIEHLFKEK